MARYPPAAPRVGPTPSHRASAPGREPGAAWAVFDVDGTLYDANTFYDFLEVYFAGRSRLRSAFFRASTSFPGKAFWLGASFVVPRKGFRDVALSSLRGERVADVEAAADDYVRRVLPASRRSEVFALLEASRDAGDRVVLMSGSIQPVIDAVARAVGADEAYAVRLEVEGERYSGRVLDDPKGAKLAALRAAYDGPFRVVTDNRDDVDLVREATEAHVVSRRKHRTWWAERGVAGLRLLDAGR